MSKIVTLEDGKVLVESLGLVFLPTEPGEYNHLEAMKLENETKRLPTIGELRLAWEAGVKFESSWYWSASVYPNYNYNNAFYLYGNNGNINYYNRNYFDGSVRCVLRENK